MSRTRVLLATSLLAGLVPAVLATAVATADTSTPPSSPPIKAHVVEQANQLSGKVIPVGKDVAVPVTPFVDGCDRGYGTPGQCVPLRAPGNRPVTCHYLLEAGWLKTPLAYTNDHLHLVVHGIVCGQYASVRP